MKFLDVLLTLTYVGTAFSAAVPISNTGLTKRDWSQDGSEDTCGGTTWEGGVKGMSAAVTQDCLEMLEDDSFGTYYRGYFSVTATDLTQFGNSIVRYKTCMFTAAVAQGATLHIGVDDIADLVRDSVARFDRGGMVIANGAMSCSGDSGDGQMKWSLARIQ